MIMKQYRVLVKYEESNKVWQTEGEEIFKSKEAAIDYINYEQMCYDRMSFKIQSRKVSDWEDETV